MISQIALICLGIVGALCCCTQSGVDKHHLPTSICQSDPSSTIIGSTALLPKQCCFQRSLCRSVHESIPLLYHKHELLSPSLSLQWDTTAVLDIPFQQREILTNCMATYGEAAYIQLVNRLRQPITGLLIRTHLWTEYTCRYQLISSCRRDVLSLPW